MSSKHFSDYEMQCPCCGLIINDDEFLSMLEMAREDAGIPFRINSWCRCPKHDKDVRGEGNHITGKAVDIGYDTHIERAIIVFSLIRAGFLRIGISFKRKFIHVDNNLIDRSVPALWSYE